MTQVVSPNGDISHAPVGTCSDPTPAYYVFRSNVPDDTDLWKALAIGVPTVEFVNPDLGTLCTVSPSSFHIEVSFPTIDDPVAHADHRLRVNIRAPGNFTVKLKQDTTVIASRSFVGTGIFQNFDVDLTTAEAAAITNYSLLRARVEPILSQGPPGETAGIDWMQFTCPDSPLPALPLAPSDLTLAVNNWRQVTGSWVNNASEPAITSLELEEGAGPTPGSGYTVVATLAPSVVTKQVDVLIPLPPPVPMPVKCYRIRAKNINGYSAYSNILCTSGTPGPPVLPQAFGNKESPATHPIDLPYDPEVADAPTYTPQTT